ncbi:MAG: TetR/AcrR family transcriptional regulator [Deltaproteobacteria bacterium CG07_land_8_20_14_0_80_60_11]|nr:MAG: TetR/AcrR family transcriptional regulator [Deltaproteobacteria bacterium CG07_land_8_20_14_0_80_60_11]
MREEAALSTFRRLPPDKQERVLDAALAEFADQGYHQASLNRVVAQAGIAKGSLYQYFPNKEGIFSYIFQYALKLVRRTLTTVKEETLEENFFVRLEKSLLAGVAFSREHPRIFSLYLKIQFDKNVPFREEFLAAVRRHAGEYFGSLVRRAQSRGELRPGVPREATLFLLDAVFDRFLQAVAVPALDVTLGLHRATDAAIHQHVRELVGLLKEGLMA